MSMTIEERIDEIEKRLQALEESDLRIILSTNVRDFQTMKELVNQYGVFVSKTTASKILGVTRATVYAMLADGRLQGAYGGKRVDVRSVARYMASSGKRKR